MRLLRPAAGLRHAAPGDRVAGMLGALPCCLSPRSGRGGTAHGPLSFVAAVALPRSCPDGIKPYDQVELTAEAIVTAPGLEHPDLQAAFKAPSEDLRAFLRHPVNDVVGNA